MLYRNRGDGTFEDVTARANLPVTGIRYGSGFSFVDCDRDGYLDLFIANYVDLDLPATPAKASTVSGKTSPSFAARAVCR